MWFIILHDTEVLILIKIAVCDDDDNMIQELKNRICDYMDRTSYNADILAFSCAEDLIKCDVLFDIVFLDIQMGSLNGMDAAKRLRQAGSECFLIFITILKEYVYDAFSVEASEYLLKIWTVSVFNPQWTECFTILRRKKHPS